MPRSSTLRSLALGIGITALTWLGGASEASALVCGERVISSGDPVAYVRSLCGDPASVVSRVVRRASAVFGRGFADSASVSVVVEDWVYDFGPDRLMVQLTFENGVLIADRTLTRGTYAGHEPTGPGAPPVVYTHRDSNALHRHRD